MATSKYQCGCSACFAVAMLNGDFERLRELMRIPGVRSDETCWVEAESLYSSLQKLVALTSRSETISGSQSHFKILCDNSAPICSSLLIKNKNKYEPKNIIDLAILIPGDTAIRILIVSNKFHLAEENPGESGLPQWRSPK